MSKKLISALATGVFVIIAIAVVLPGFIRARATKASNACPNNLRQVDGAKQQWQLENKATNGAAVSWDEVRPYMGRGPEGTLPRCPEGGTYILGRIGEKPRCSIGGTHTLPDE